jgi:sugar-specific transcriptional regulator TrmB
MLDQTLKQLGLGHDAIKLYQQLISSGHMTAGQLARLTGLARATVYDHLDRLSEQSLVTQTLYRGVKNFSAEPLQKITHLMMQKIETLEASKKEFEKALPNLIKQQQPFIVPRFQLFDGPLEIQNILNDILLYPNSETRSFWPISSSINALSADYLKKHNEKRIENNIRIKAIWPAKRRVSIEKYSFLGSGKAHLRQIRIAPLDIDFEMGYWIYGTKVAFLSSAKESIGFIVESREMVDMMTVQHDIIWRLSTPIEKIS